jgi:nitrite reductase/ring-hydroxylating ferredoxin subunit
MGQKYAAFDGAGQIVGFYDDDIHPSIPEASIAITDEQWQDCIAHQGKWQVAAGELTLAPAVAPTVEQLIAANTAAVQKELDRRAQEKGYDNIVSACSYAAQEAGAPFQAEGAAFLQWRSAVWTQAYAVLAEVQAGNAPMPSPAEAVAMMPILSLPA